MWGCGRRKEHITLLRSCGTTVDSPEPLDRRLAVCHMWAAAPNDSLFLKGRACLLAMLSIALRDPHNSFIISPIQVVLDYKEGRAASRSADHIQWCSKTSPCFPQTAFHGHLISIVTQADNFRRVSWQCNKLLRHISLCTLRTNTQVRAEPCRWMVALCCRLSGAGITSATPACPADRAARGTLEKKKNSFYSHLLICNSHPWLKVGPCFLMCFWILSLFLTLFLIKGLIKLRSVNPIGYDREMWDSDAHWKHNENSAKWTETETQSCINTLKKPPSCLFVMYSHPLGSSCIIRAKEEREETCLEALAHKCCFLGFLKKKKKRFKNGEIILWSHIADHGCRAA